MKRKVFMSVVAFVCLIAYNVSWGDALGGGGHKYDDRVGTVLRELNLKYDIDKDGDYRVTFDMGEGRSQLAIIMSKTNNYRNLEVREIWSVGYRGEEGEEFPSYVANLLLEDTFPKIIGAWAKTKNMAIYVVRLSADADSESLLSGLKVALQAADEMETKLSGDADKF